MSDSINLARETSDSAFKRRIVEDLVVTCEHVYSEEDGDEVEVIVTANRVELMDPIYVSLDEAGDTEAVADEIADDMDIDDETLIRAFSFEATTDGSDDEAEQSFSAQRSQLERIVAEHIAERAAAFAASL
jgi:hypothetical protein